MKDTKMTPEQKLKWAILLDMEAGCDDVELPEITAENVDALYEEFDEKDYIQDPREDFRTTGAETGIRSENYSRHYESEEVAAQMPDGSWVGWTYWHGGGKHGEPSAMPWMEDAYDLACEEKEVMTTVRTFTKA